MAHSISNLRMKTARYRWLRARESDSWCGALYEEDKPPLGSSREEWARREDKARREFFTPEMERELRLLREEIGHLIG